MPRPGAVIAIFGAVVSLFALLSTTVFLVLPHPAEQQTSALQQMPPDPGFLTDATLHVIPVAPRQKAGLAGDAIYAPGLTPKIQETADWFNAGAQGVRRIFANVTGEEPRILTPQANEAENEPGDSAPDTAQSTAKGVSHDCDPLLQLALAESQVRPPDTVVVLLVEDTWKCPFVGMAGFESNWVIITGWRMRTNSFNHFTLIHELGHVLGLPHARRYDCSANVGLYERPKPLAQCETKEYGDLSDPMGSTLDEMEPGFNAFNRYLLGWNEPPIVIETPGVHTVKIPLATLPGPGYVEIPGGFLLSYRAPSGREEDIDAKLGWNTRLGNLAGVYLHRKASSKDDGSTYPIMLTFRPLAPTGRPGDHFVSIENNVAFIIRRVVPGEYAIAEVHVGTKRNPVRDIWGPSIYLEHVTDLPTSSSLEAPAYFHLQWAPFDASGVVGDYAVVDGRRIDDVVGGGIFIGRGEQPQKVRYVAIDREGNVSKSAPVIVPAASAAADRATEMARRPR